MQLRIQGDQEAAHEKTPDCNQYSGTWRVAPAGRGFSSAWTIASSCTTASASASSVEPGSQPLLVSTGVISPKQHRHDATATLASSMRAPRSRSPALRELAELKVVRGSMLQVDTEMQR